MPTPTTPSLGDRDRAFEYLKKQDKPQKIYRHLLSAIEPLSPLMINRALGWLDSTNNTSSKLSDMRRAGLVRVHHSGKCTTTGETTQYWVVEATIPNPIVWVPPLRWFIVINPSGQTIGCVEYTDENKDEKLDAMVEAYPPAHGYRIMGATEKTMFSGA